MRHTYLNLALVLALALVFSACGLIHSKTKSDAQKAVAAATPYPDGARRVTIDEMESLVKEGKAVVIDVRSQDAYDAGHIPGAKLIPAGEILNHLSELPKDKLIITYCS
ncbi:MAG TPA: rhodanese-like domain-containing protein [Pyrinomonadaceae bacterium]|nr:rhodanese-like domain-containing protein [Pyrinomonadaceae bacterium]